MDRASRRDETGDDGLRHEARRKARRALAAIFERGTELIMAAEAQPEESTRLRCDVWSSDAKAVEALRLLGDASTALLLRERDSRPSLGNVWGTAAATEAAVGVRSPIGDSQPIIDIANALATTRGGEHLADVCLVEIGEGGLRRRGKGKKTSILEDVAGRGGQTEALRWHGVVVGGSPGVHDSVHDAGGARGALEGASCLFCGDDDLDDAEGAGEEDASLEAFLGDEYRCFF